ncbi:MAG: hypothetical protein GY787_32475 [Alteromonadales bacterium]|nr:hypothetical protein [Alteromonadales bacterium]
MNQSTNITDKRTAIHNNRLLKAIEYEANGGVIKRIPNDEPTYDWSMSMKQAQGASYERRTSKK